MKKKTTWMANKIKVRSPGDPLIPDGLLNTKFLEKMKRQSGRYYFEALYQGNPTAKGAGYFDEETFRYYKSAPKGIKHSVITVDAAEEDKASSDYSVLQYWTETEASYNLINCVRGKWKFPQLQTEVISFYNKYKPNRVVIEPKSNGKALIQNLKHMGKIPVIPVDPKFMRLSKQERTNQIIGQVESGNVLFPEDVAWLWDFKSEVLDFDNGEHDDQVDAMVHAIYYLVYKKKLRRIRSL